MMANLPAPPQAAIARRNLRLVASALEREMAENCINPMFVDRVRAQVQGLLGQAEALRPPAGTGHGGGPAGPAASE